MDVASPGCQLLRVGRRPRSRASVGGIAVALVLALVLMASLFPRASFSPDPSAEGRAPPSAEAEDPDLATPREVWRSEEGERIERVQEQTRIAICGEEVPPPRAADLAEEARAIVDELEARRRRVLQGAPASPELRSGLGALSDASRHDHALGLIDRAEDRSVDAFDFGLAARVLGVFRALGASDIELARRRSEETVRAREGASVAWAVRALVALRGRDQLLARRALGRAFRIDPASPPIAYHLAVLEGRRGEPDLALEALHAYLDVVGDDPAADAMMRRFHTQSELREGYRRARRGAIVLVSTPRLNDQVATRVHLRLLEILDEAERRLGLEAPEELIVVVYADRTDLVGATCGARWTGGLYDGALHLHADLFAQPDGGRRVMRHETLHAVLGPHAPRAPTWMQEGLAQRFARERTPALERTLSLMRREGTYIPFPSIEGSFQVIDDRQDALFAYHQSYAMVGLLDARLGSGWVARAVSLLGSGTPPDRLLDALASRRLTENDLLDYLASQAGSEGR